MKTGLPIDDALPEVVGALAANGMAVLQAPPGAGKTTVVPLALREAGLAGHAPDRRLIMLEPRRLAARAAAERMSEITGQPIGQAVGYRIRGESKVSGSTGIEVVTEGILTRMLQSDPDLPGVAAVIFDEFHERSLNADLGLALALEARSALREDLLLLPMSATLDAGPVARLMGDAPIVTSEGRTFPVEIQHWPTPVAKGAAVEPMVAQAVRDAMTRGEGGVLVFLPGEREIRRTSAALGNLGADTVVHQLYGAMPFADQRAAIEPNPDGKRKIVLATAIAETSLTIEGVTLVIDAGFARRSRYDPRSGMARLVTEPVSRAEATQRAGRAGRFGPGRCLRLWAKGQDGALPAFAPAEIEITDLAPLALELSLWGDPDGTALPFLTPPPEGTLQEARGLLTRLGAVGQDGSITTHGRAMARLPLHPRLGQMLLTGGRRAAALAALIADRDPLRGAPSDATLRLRAITGEKDVPGQANPQALRRIRDEARRLARSAPKGREISPATAAALAYPDRVGLRRPGEEPRWLLSGGKGATMAREDPLANARLLVALDLDGDVREARIRMALQLSESELRGAFAEQITWRNVAEWSRRERKVVARRQERFGALVLDDRHWRDAGADQLGPAVLDGIRDLGLPWTVASRRLQARAERYRTAGGGIADLSDAALEHELEAWLLPFLSGVRTAEDIRALDLIPPLEARVGYDTLRRLDAEMPASFTTPLGRKIPIDYTGDTPEISARVQEMFGTARHPTVGPDRVPLRVTLLSPARRPVQVTMDLPGFWKGSYADMRKDMRAQYPKHPWPEDPLAADPTLRAKNRR